MAARYQGRRVSRRDKSTPRIWEWGWRRRQAHNSLKNKDFWRRGWDSNPRYGFSLFLLFGVFVRIAPHVIAHLFKPILFKLVSVYRPDHHEDLQPDRPTPS